MKINEFNNKTRVDEIDFKSLGSAIKKSFTTQSSEEKVQSEFIKSYINTISSSLYSAIQGGAVSPTSVVGSRRPSPNPILPINNHQLLVN
jgi:hypothetical protein